MGVLFITVLMTMGYLMIFVIAPFGLFAASIREENKNVMIQ